MYIWKGPGDLCLTWVVVVGKLFFQVSSNKTFICHFALHALSFSWCKWLSRGLSKTFLCFVLMHLSLPVKHFIPSFTASCPSLMFLSAAVRPHQSSHRHSKEHRSLLAAEILQEWRCSWRRRGCTEDRPKPTGATTSSYWQRRGSSSSSSSFWWTRFTGTKHQ